MVVVHQANSRAPIECLLELMAWRVKVKAAREHMCHLYLIDVCRSWIIALLVSCTGHHGVVACIVSAFKLQLHSKERMQHKAGSRFQNGNLSHHSPSPNVLGVMTVWQHIACSLAEGGPAWAASVVAQQSSCSQCGMHTLTLYTSSPSPASTIKPSMTDIGTSHAGQGMLFRSCASTTPT